MGTGSRILRAMSLSIALFCVCVLQAQTPPPESTSKVKRVLLYNYNGGWDCASCREKVQQVFFHMAQAKGFTVDTTSSVALLTLENLKRYQAIVWNNNTNGAASVPDSQARNAVSEYVLQGGGWMLVNLANEHQRTWSFPDHMIGPGTSGWVGQGASAILIADSAATNHPELRYLVMALPDTIPLHANWMVVRPWMDEHAHLKTVYKVKNAPWISITPNPDFYNENYVWAGTREKGKALAIPLGWEANVGAKAIMTQADSAVPRLYWQGLRWLAGDFQNGCINPDMPNYDPEARVDDGSCQILGIKSNRRHVGNHVKMAGRRILLRSPVSAGSRLRLLDLRGLSVWRYTAPRSLSDFDLPDGLLPGLYFIDVSGAGASFQERFFIP